MSTRYLGFVLLIWFPGALHAQSATQSCRAPRLDGGFFAPKQETYSHESKLTYTCDDGRKPAVKGWWATSTCQNGKWSHQPQCIDKDACFPPEIPNAKYTDNQNGWFADGRVIRITCDKGYEPKDRVATATCINGKWSSLLVCEKSIQACGEPPKIPHAVIINQIYQEVFAVDSEVQYECKDGYAIEGADSQNSIICMAGNWTDGPTCSIATGPGTGQGGAAGGGHTSANSGTQLGGGGRGTRSGTGQGGSTEKRTAGGHTTSTVGSGRQPGGGDLGRGTKPGTGQGGSVEEGTAGGHTTSTVGSGRQPRVGGSSTASGWNDRPLLVPVEHCGAPPVVENGVLMKEERMSLKYQCNAFYTTVSSDTVLCHSNSSWSELPICKEAFCRLDPAQYSRPIFKLSGVEYLKEGETKYIPCITHDLSSRVQCTNGRIRFTRCRETKPGAGHGGSTVEGTAGGHTTSAGSGTQPAGGDRGTRTGTGQGGPAGGGHTTSANSGRQPGGGGSSTTSGSNDRPLLMPVVHCGAHPVVENSVLLKVERTSLKYQCKAYYTIVGSDTVTCYNDGTWSEIPTCKEAFCRPDLAQYRSFGFQWSGAEFLEEGETKWFPCIWSNYRKGFHCSNGEITFTECCHNYEISRGLCRVQRSTVTTAGSF